MKSNLSKFISKYNPLSILRRHRMRKQIINTTPTFLCPNCIGGILFHDLGLRFLSPTVNTMLHTPDFVKFVLNLDYYLSQPLVFFKKANYNCPCAKLDDITVHFTHYATPEEAEKKWKERSERINKDNMFIYLSERDGVTEQEIRSLDSLKVRGLCVFTSNEYPDIPYAVHIPKYKQNGVVGNILERSYINDSREFEKYFDFIKWFNEADGKTKSVEPFKRV